MRVWSYGVNQKKYTIRSADTKSAYQKPKGACGKNYLKNIEVPSCGKPRENLFAFWLSKKHKWQLRCYNWVLFSYRS